MNDYLLKSIGESHFADTAPSKGRSVAEQFAHIHNVRMLWLKAAKPQLLDGLTKVEKGTSFSKDLLLEELSKSAAAINKLLEAGLLTGRIKGFKPSPQAFVAYLTAHGAHHRGQIIQTLKMNGHLPNKKFCLICGNGARQSELKRTFRFAGCKLSNNFATHSGCRAAW